MNKKPGQAGAEIPKEELLVQWDYSQKVRGIFSRKALAEGKPVLALVKTFGCQGNIADSEKLMGLLCEMGCQPTEDEATADVILYNTCAVRENAEARLFGVVGELKKLKESKPSLLIGLCGCMMQQAGMAEKVKKSYRQVDLIFGTQAIHTLPELLFRVLEDEKTVVSCEEIRLPQLAENLPMKRGKGVQASLQIMYGCDNFCSYCIVPYVRGREVSRRPEMVIDEAKKILSQGYKEILLLGQNVNSYGKGLSEAVNFPLLLERLSALEGDFRIRFMTAHPKDCTNELIDTISRCDKVCRSIHLPVQSGSNRILKEMNRHYTRENYLELISYAKEKLPGVTFTSDIIVGFPGETEEDFLETLSLVEQVRYQSLFTFIYSPRPGTAAAKLPDSVSHKEKSQWLNRLIEVQHRISEEDNALAVGKVLPVLAEGISTAPGNSALIGRSETGLLVRFPGDKELIGQTLNVIITAARRSELEGRIL